MPSVKTPESAKEKSLPERAKLDCIYTHPYTMQQLCSKSDMRLDEGTRSCELARCPIYESKLAEIEKYVREALRNG